VAVLQRAELTVLTFYHLDQLSFRVSWRRCLSAGQLLRSDDGLGGSCQSVQTGLPPPQKKKTLRARPQRVKIARYIASQTNRWNGKMLAKRSLWKQKIPSYTSQPVSQTSFEICVEELIADMKMEAVRGLGTGWDKHAVSPTNSIVVYQVLSNLQIYILPDFRVISEIKRSKKVLVFTQDC